MGVIKGDTRSLDYSSSHRHAFGKPNPVGNGMPEASENPGVPFYQSL